MGLSSEDWRPENRKQVADEIQGGDDAKQKEGSVLGVRAEVCEVATFTAEGADAVVGGVRTLDTPHAHAHRSHRRSQVSDDRRLDCLTSAACV
ncbi:hypothetical protein C0Q70_01736 [Pomacea canaliculata]|uniref:Uncharacterized protein n=1 Tax=Pomacea canaliculata TaxID=400727 RepID=A0A2T7Q0B5_POMCA|nr:hypothetical protein C0Q70_01736 [Pomacea canaliculata]